MKDENSIFTYTEEDKQYVRNELGLTESTIEEGIDAIQDWFNKQPHLVDAGIERITIEQFLIIAKGSLEKTKKRIDNLYKYRATAPELIQNRDKYLNDPADLWNSYIQVSMPRLLNGHRIAVVKFIDSDPAKFSCEQLFRNTFMIGDLRMKYDYFLADIWVMDMQNAGFGHLMRMNPLILQKTSNIFHKGLGIRIQAIHIVNATNLLTHVVSLMRQFFSAKVMDRLIIHDALEDLYKHVPKRYLPKDYGGDQPYIMEFKDKYEKEFRTTRTKKLLIEASKMVSDESRRPNPEKNDDFLVGSFRKLDFD